MIPRLFASAVLLVASCHTPEPPRPPPRAPAGTQALPPAVPSVIVEAPPAAASPPGPPLEIAGADRAEADVDRRGAVLVLGDGAKLRIEARGEPVHVVFARVAAAKKKGAAPISATYAIEASAPSHLVLDVPYKVPASWRRPCNVTPYPEAMFFGDVERKDGTIEYRMSTSATEPTARLVLDPGNGSLPTPFRARFALHNTFPCP